MSAELDKQTDDSSSVLSTFLPSKSLNSQLTDKLVEKFVLMALPSSDNPASDASIQQRLIDSANRHQFSVQIMSTNFINMNSRLSIPFITINNILKIFNWESISFNVFLLIVLTNLLLSPLPILLSMPFFLMVFGIMVPKYLEKYSPDNSNYELIYHINQSPFPTLNPINQVIEARPCNQFSKEFFVNMTDLQNFMVVYIIGWDYLNNILKKVIYFKFEALSNFIFLGLLIMGTLGLLIFPKMLVFCLPLVKLLAIAALWGIMIMLHPKNRDKLLEILDFDGFIHRKIEKYSETLQSQEESRPNDKPISKLKTKMKPDRQKILSNINYLLNKKHYFEFLNSEFDYNMYHQSLPREVYCIEIYELQSFNKIEKEWNPSIYSPDPFTRNSDIRKAHVNAKKLSKKIQDQNDHIKAAASLSNSSAPNSNSNYSLTSYLMGDISTESIVNNLVGGEEEQEAEEGIFPAEYCSSLKLVIAPKNYRFVSEAEESNDVHGGWKLDLVPHKWCEANYILPVVDIDDDAKWVFDAENGVRVKEIRRRRWFRYVERISDYDETYEGMESSVFVDTDSEHDDENAIDEDDAKKEDEGKPMSNEPLDIDTSEQSLFTEKNPHNRSTSFTEKLMTFLNDGE